MSDNETKNELVRQRLAEMIAERLPCQPLDVLVRVGIAVGAITTTEAQIIFGADLVTVLTQEGARP